MAPLVKAIAIALAIAVHWHRRLQKFFQGEKRRNLTYHFQVVSDAMQVHVHKQLTLHPFHPICLYWFSLQISHNLRIINGHDYFSGEKKES